MKPVKWGGIWSTEPISLGLARLTETPTHMTPAGFAEWQQTANRTDAQLVVLDALRPAALYRDVDVWSQTLEELERHWFEPLLRALKARTLESAAILTDTGQCFPLTARHARRWWRRAKSILSYR